MKERIAALRIQKIYRGYHERKVYKKKLKAIVYMQSCIRRRHARLELKLLRVEAKSLTKYDFFF